MKQAYPPPPQAYPPPHHTHRTRLMRRSKLITASHEASIPPPTPHTQNKVDEKDQVNNGRGEMVLYKADMGLLISKHMKG